MLLVTYINSLTITIVAHLKHIQILIYFVFQIIKHCNEIENIHKIGYLNLSLNNVIQYLFHGNY